MGKFVDLTGKRYGRLVVICNNGKKNGSIAWLCQCDCGNTVTVSSRGLNAGESKSCGCYHKDIVNQPKEDITGRKFNYLTALRYLGRGKWECKCDCGNPVIVCTRDLKTGHTKSCGCYSRNCTIERNRKHDYAHTRIYSIWCDIRRRCYDTRRVSYEHYGARGISMCDDWRKDFATFKDWAMANGYRDNLTIERIDVNGDYCPENCTWIPQSEQSRNRTYNHRITINGETHNISDWARLANISLPAICKRISQGYSDVDAVLYYMNKITK